jgi:hypothetical protein
MTLAASGAGTPSQLAEIEMAQRVTVALEDDLDGGPAEQTARFMFGGAEHEIRPEHQERHRIP